MRSGVAMDIVLIGLRGCGKSTLGERLSAMTRRLFVDVDDVVLERFDEGRVGDVWRVHGEVVWRDAEVAVCRELFDEDCDGDDRVVAMGGGCAVIPDVQRLLRSGQQAKRVCVGFLRCGPEVLHQRLMQSESSERDDRPALTDLELKDEIREMMRRREPTYRSLADFEIDVSALGIADAAQRIIRHCP